MVLAGASLTPHSCVPDLQQAQVATTGLTSLNSEILSCSVDVLQSGSVQCSAQALSPCLLVVWLPPLGGVGIVLAYQVFSFPRFPEFWLEVTVPGSSLNAAHTDTAS